MRPALSGGEALRRGSLPFPGHLCNNINNVWEAVWTRKSLCLRFQQQQRGHLTAQLVPHHFSSLSLMLTHPANWLHFFWVKYLQQAPSSGPLHSLSLSLAHIFPHSLESPILSCVKQKNFWAKCFSFKNRKGLFSQMPARKGPGWGMKSKPPAAAERDRKDNMTTVLKLTGFYTLCFEEGRYKSFWKNLHCLQTGRGQRKVKWGSSKIGTQGRIFTTFGELQATVLRAQAQAGCRGI